MMPTVDWGKVLQDMDWAAVIATVGAVVVAIITFASAKSIERNAKTQEGHIDRLVTALETANAQASEQLKRTGTQMTRLITALQKVLPGASK